MELEVQEQLRAGFASKVKSAFRFPYTTQIKSVPGKRGAKQTMNANMRNFEAELEAQNLEVEEAPKLSSESEVVTATAL